MSKTLSRKKPEIAMVAVGSVVNHRANGDMEHCVVITSVGHNQVHYTPMGSDGARLLGKQLAEWADHADKQNETSVAHEWKYIFKAAAKDIADKSEWTAVDMTDGECAEANKKAKSKRVPASSKEAGHV